MLLSRQALLLMLVAAVHVSLLHAVADGPQYTINDGVMYVWTSSYNPTLPDCINFCENSPSGCPECWEYLWGTSLGRTRILRAAKDVGIGTILLSGVSSVMNEMKNSPCPNPSTSRYIDMQNMLVAAHAQGVRVYALFADSDAAFSEQYYAPLLKQYNDNCAGASNKKFDGISVNNEAMSTILSADHPCQETSTVNAVNAWLDGLQNCAEGAAPYPMHMSMGHWWDDCKVTRSLLEGTGTASRDVNEWIVRYTDSTDIQVGTNKAVNMVDRVSGPAFDTAMQQGKDLHILAYTSIDTACTIGFSFLSLNPAVCAESCLSSSSTCLSLDIPNTCEAKRCSERGLLYQLTTAESMLPGVKAGWHAFSDTFDSGAPGWPIHDPAVAALSATVITPTASPPGSTNLFKCSTMQAGGTCTSVTSTWMNFSLGYSYSNPACGFIELDAGASTTNDYGASQTITSPLSGSYTNNLLFSVWGSILERVDWSNTGTNRYPSSSIYGIYADINLATSTGRMVLEKGLEFVALILI